MIRLVELTFILLLTLKCQYQFVNANQEIMNDNTTLPTLPNSSDSQRNFLNEEIMVNMENTTSPTLFNSSNSQQNSSDDEIMENMENTTVSTLLNTSNSSNENIMKNMKNTTVLTSANSNNSKENFSNEEFHDGRSRYKQWTDKDKQAYERSRLKAEQFDYERAYELEVKEAQNSAICNYTVIPIPNPGGRIPADLEHIKCNHAGSKCQDRGTYCCTQLYRNVDITYKNGQNEMIKVYSGCVCTLQIYEVLEPHLPDLSKELNYK